VARTKRKTNPVIPAAEAPAQAQKQYRAAAYARLSVEDSGKPGADTIEGQKNLLLRFVENDPTLTLYGLFCDNGQTGTDFQRPEFEKLMGKKKFKEILGEYVVKPPGKLALVPDSDPREAVDLETAEDEFTPLD